MSPTAKRKPKTATTTTKPTTTAANPAVIHAIADQYLDLAVKIKDPEGRPDYVRVVIALDRHAGQLLEEAMNAGALTSYPELAEARKPTLEENPDCYAGFWNHAMHTWSVKIPACVRGGPGSDSIGSVEFAAKCRAVAGVLHAEAKAMDGGEIEQVPALSNAAKRVLRALGRLDPADSATVEQLAEPTTADSVRTIEQAIRELIGALYAERPNGRAGGARLTIRGRRVLSKIAD
ncbi:MAG: hypothetical protein K8S99_06925 [Planctomycetes bacterium]|nr:hypothetical protein [Planctomycetota bacterium]